MGRKIDPEGYVRLGGTQFHPRGWIYEHRWVVEQELGRRLTDRESVHHRNHIKHDNRYENLEIVERASHASEHARERYPRRAAGAWSESHDACTTCKRSDSPCVRADGTCNRCYQREYARARRRR